MPRGAVKTTPNKTKSKRSTTTPVPRGDAEERLFARVIGILESARTHVARSVNTTMVQAYWLIGREIVEVEQRGSKRAGYGDEVIERLAKRLKSKVGKGFGSRTLRRIRQLYVTYPEGSLLPHELGGSPKRTAALSKSKSEIRTAVPSELETAFPPHLGWSHYLVLLKVTNPTARAFYEIEATRENWSSRELERQVSSLLFERLAKSRDKKKGSSGNVWV